MQRNTTEYRTPWLTQAELDAARTRKGITKVSRTRKGVPSLPSPRHYRWDGRPVASQISVTERQSAGQIWSRREKSWYGTAMDRDWYERLGKRPSSAMPSRLHWSERPNLVVAKSY